MLRFLLPLFFCLFNVTFLPSPERPQGDRLLKHFKQPHCFPQTSQAFWCFTKNKKQHRGVWVKKVERHCGVLPPLGTLLLYAGLCYHGNLLLMYTGSVSSCNHTTRPILYFLGVDFRIILIESLDIHRWQWPICKESKLGLKNIYKKWL